jgi:hypothetical protein
MFAAGLSPTEPRSSVIRFGRVTDLVAELIFQDLKVSDELYTVS